MTLDDIKLKRLGKARQINEEKNASNQSGGTLDEGEKKHHTPKFVQHCVSAITEDPKKLAQVKAGGPDGEGSPFAICNASYKKKTRSKAADHAQQAKGEKKHHTVKDYESALKKLRESVEERAASNVDPRGVAFGPMLEEHTPTAQIRFSPQE